MVIHHIIPVQAFILHISQNCGGNYKHEEMVSGVDRKKLPGFIFPGNPTQINGQIKTQPGKN
jgi:hypothetical protein